MISVTVTSLDQHVDVLSLKDATRRYVGLFQQLYNYYTATWQQLNYPFSKNLMKT